MCIYCGTKHYRKIYEQHYGSIPIDIDDKSYDIHHIDGNHLNNDPSNLIAITINDHYDIHYHQGDYYACYLIATQRMNKSKDEISELAKLNNLKRVADGTNPFLGGEMQRESNNKKVLNGTHHLLKRPDGTSVASDAVSNGTHNLLKRPDGTSVASDRVANGTHHLLGGEIQRASNNKRVLDGTHNWLGEKNPNHKRILDGTHNLLGENNPSHKRILDGTHNFIQCWTCEHCGKNGKGMGLYHRWHGDRCKVLKLPEE